MKKQTKEKAKMKKSELETCVEGKGKDENKITN